MRGRSYFKLDGDYTPLNFTPLFISLPITPSHSISTRTLSLSLTTYHSLSTHTLSFFLTLSKYTLSLFFSLSTHTYSLYFYLTPSLSLSFHTHTFSLFFILFFSFSDYSKSLSISNKQSFFFLCSFPLLFFSLSLS